MPRSQLIRYAVTAGLIAVTATEIAYAAGYRIEPSDRLSADLALLANDYDRIVAYVPAAEGFEFTPVPHFALTIAATKVDWASTHGGEVSIQWKPAENRRVVADHDINLVRDFQTEPVIEMEKHKVLQILVHLIRNARYACDDSGRSGKQMIIRSGSDAAGVKPSVIDNGAGIAP